MIKFSVVMPVYKTHREIILRAIASVQAQSYPAWELIVVDDNPKDSDHKKIARQMQQENRDSRIQYIIQEDNRGANAARNAGVFAGAGDWIAFVDADDQWLPDYLQRCSEIIGGNPDVSLISSAYYIITRGRTVKVCQNLPKGNYYRQELYDDAVSPTSAVTVKADVLRSVGAFDEKMPARQDYDTWLRVSKAHDFYFNTEPSVNIYRDGHDSISTNYKNHVNGTLMVLGKIRAQVPEEALEEIAQSHYLHIAEYCIQFSAFDEAKVYAKKCRPCKRSRKVLLICAFPRAYLAAKKTVRKLVRLVR